MDINFALCLLWWILYFNLIYSTSDVDSTYICNEATKKFRCGSGECISILAKCDFKFDCDDLSDEKDCDRPPCNNSTQFECTNRKCIAKEDLCDRFDDCYDNSDETHPDCLNKTCTPTQFQCQGSQICNPLAWKCDDDIDCEHGDDEQNCKPKICSEDQFKCESGTCIDIKWKCDEEDDCRDGSDEKGCIYETCKAGTEFKCTRHHQCIPHSWRCDNAVDCIDKSDELNCTSTPPKCPSSYIPCNSGTPRCILPSWKCDGNLDCSDGSDELHCENILNDCPDGEKLCDNRRQCVSEDKFCDGVRDCVDKSDENRCKDSTALNSDCPLDTHYRCKGDKNVCIRLKSFCDGTVDCVEGEDEKKGSHFCDYDECEAFNGNCSDICQDRKFGYQCSCPEGYKLINGTTCMDIDECETDSSTCDQGCLNFSGKYKCFCYAGYLVDAATMKCKPSEINQISLLVADKTSIAKINLHSETFHEVVLSDISKPSAIAIDQDKHIVYWTDIKNEKILRSEILPLKKAKKLGKKEILLDTDINTPNGITIDWTHQHLYWTDSFYKTVFVSYLNGSYPKTLFEVQANYLSGIAVHPQDGFLFVSILSLLSSSGIKRCSMDGCCCKYIITESGSWPVTLTIDMNEDRLYWIDTRLSLLASSDLNGQHRQNVFYSTKYISSPSSISAFSGQIYWTELVDGLVLNIDKRGKDLRVIDRHIHLPSAVEVYHPGMQVNTTNYCLNSPCKFMCLPRAISDDVNSLRYSCVCPDHYTTKPDDLNDCIKIMPTKNSTSNQTVTLPPSTLITTSPVSSRKTTTMKITTTKAKKITEASTLVTIVEQEISTLTMNASHRVDSIPLHDGMSDGVKVFIALGVIALLVLSVVLTCYILRWHKQRTERQSMNFNNPIYRKVSENSRNDSYAGLDDKSSDDISAIEPTTSSLTAELVLNEQLPDLNRERRYSNDSVEILPLRNGHAYSKVKTNEDQNSLMK